MRLGRSALRRLPAGALYASYLVVATALLLELASRTVLESRVPPYASDERAVAYRHDALLGWFPIENRTVSVKGSFLTIDVHHNNRGFRDRDHVRAKKHPRVVFLGDSFVWGYDVLDEERFSDVLQRRLDRVEILNLGVSGYGTDQCYLLIRKHFDFYQPEIVVYMYSDTDVFDNAVNFNYGAYYKPYFVPVGQKLKLEGVPVPRSATYFFRDELPLLGRSRAVRLLGGLLDRIRYPRRIQGTDLSPSLVFYMDQFVRSHGARFLVGLIDPSESLSELLRRARIPAVDLTSIGAAYRYPDAALHWNPRGHERAAELIRAFLLDNGVVAAHGISEP